MCNSSSGSGSLTVQSANSALTVTDTNSPITYNSGSETFDLTANVTSTNGGTVGEGDVVFTVNGVFSAPVAVSNGTASDALTPTGTSLLVAGNYPVGVSASYTDTATNNYASANATGAVAVSAAATTTTIASTVVSSTFNSTTPQTVTLSATVDSGNGGTVNEGSVTFSVTGTSLTATGNVSGGTATATLTIPAGFAAGSYSFTAGYADTTNTNGTVNFESSTAATTGTLTVSAASTQTGQLTTAVSSTYNSTTAQTVILSASVTSADIVNEGAVHFTVVPRRAKDRVAAASVSNGMDLTAAANVSNGMATATLTMPAGFTAGSYTINAGYAGANDYLASTSATSGTLSVNAAVTTTVIAIPASISYNSTAAQTVTLTATIVSPSGGVVNEGVVTFTVINPVGGNLTASAAVASNGTATATLTIPAGLSAGNYLFTASYADNGSSNFASSSNSATLNVASAATSTSLRKILIFPMGNFAVELITAAVTSPGGTINGGMATFNVDGQIVNAAVQDGQATAMVVLPLFDAAMPQSVGLSFASSNVDFAASTASETVFLMMFNALDFGFVLFNSDGSQTVATVINGVPIGLVFNAQGHFTGFAFGILPNVP